MECGCCRSGPVRVGIVLEAMKCLTQEVASGGELGFRRQLIKERQHQRDATISNKNYIYALDRLLARSSIAPSQAPAFVE
jgi:hypothetical protein